MKSKILYNDIGEVDRYFQNKLASIKDDKELTDRNKEIILNYLYEAELGKTIKKGAKKKLASGRLLQCAGFLNQMAKYWFKDTELDKVTEKQMQAFILRLDRGEIKKSQNRSNGKDYSHSTRKNIKKFVRKFYKHILGNGTHYPELVDWIDTATKENEIKAIKGLKNSVWDMISLIPDVRRKALIAVLFDSGFREGEIINCTLSDIEKREDGVYYISCKHSKTKPRTVSLPYSSEILERWVREHPHKNNPKAQLWMTSRRMLYKTMKLYSEKALGEAYTVHQVRHTSATFFAPKMDRVAFCKKFGWSYSSSIPDRYIDFSKVEQNKIIDVVKADENAKLREELEIQKVKNLVIQDRMREMEEKSKTEMLEFKNFILEKIARDLEQRRKVKAKD